VRSYHLVPTGNSHWREQDPPAVYPPRPVTVLRFDHLEFFAEVSLLDIKLPSRQDAQQAAVIVTLRYMETLPSKTLKWLAR
jgi:hypothetical protein